MGRLQQLLLLGEKLFAGCDWLANYSGSVMAVFTLKFCDGME